jgi:DNA-binding NtrC family response regulator
MDGDIDCRRAMATMCTELGYHVIVTDKVANALSGILKKGAQVVLLGAQFDGMTACELIPILKTCNRKLTIILVAADTSLPMIRKLRGEGIFYHALKPLDAEDREEIRLAVQCAFAGVRLP